MTIFEKEQEKYSSVKKFGTNLKLLFNGKTFKTLVRLSGRKYWNDYNVEFTVENVYTSIGDMVAVDVKVLSMVTSRGIKPEGPNEVKAIIKSIKENNNLFSSDLLTKSVLYKIKYVHVNSVSVV